MEDIAAEICEGMFEGKVESEKRVSEKGNWLRVEILSVKGLPIENNEAIMHAQLHVLFRDTHLFSDPVVINSSNLNEVIFNFTGHYEYVHESMSELTRNDHCLLNICLTISSSAALSESRPSINGECLPVGLNRTRDLKAVAVLDHRLAFLHSQTFISVELMQCDFEGIDSSLSGSGVLFVKMSFIENGELHLPDIQPAAATLINEAIDMYQMRVSQGCQDNYQRARSWWALARRDFPFLDTRNIKLVAEDESGQQRFVCSFLGAIAPPREMDSPRVASRFVSLIPFRRNMSLAGGRVGKWKSAQSLLATLQGDVEDHALLLCSLLLGWGMNAWVAMGSIAASSPTTSSSMSLPMPTPTGIAHTKPHCWVVTLDALSSNRVVFWEPLTGQQYEIPLNGESGGFRVLFSPEVAQPRFLGDDRGRGDAPPPVPIPAHPFREIYSLFNCDTYYLNIQPSPGLCDVGGGLGADTGQSPKVDQRGPVGGPPGRGPGPGGSADSLGPPNAGAASFQLTDAKCWIRFQFFDPELLRHPGSRLCIPTPSPPPLSLPRSPRGAEVAMGGVGGGGSGSEELFRGRRVWGVGGRNTHVLGVEMQIEAAVRALVVQWRAEEGLQTRFDDTLSLILQPALCAYELDRSLGATVRGGDGDFQSAVKRVVGRGECFKAYPTCFAHCDVAAVAKHLRCTAAARDVALARSAPSRNVSRHGLRVKVFPYPCGLCAVWVMLAVCYDDRNSR